MDQRVRVPERLEVVAAALEDHVRMRLHRPLVGGGLLRPPPLRRREAREEERVRAEHERDLGEHLRQPLVEVGVLEERGERELAGDLLERVVRTEEDRLPRAFPPRDRREAVHLRVAHRHRVRREQRVLLDVHPARRLVRDEVAPGEDDVRQVRRLLLVGDEEPAVAVVENRHERARGEALGRVVGQRLVLVDDRAEHDVRVERQGALRVGVVERADGVAVALPQRVHRLRERLAQERLAARDAGGHGDGAVEARIRRETRVDALAGEHGGVAHEEGHLEPLPARELRAAGVRERRVPRAQARRERGEPFGLGAREPLGAHALAHALRRNEGRQEADEALADHEGLSDAAVRLK